MNSGNKEYQAKQITQRIIELANPEKVILFGSIAKGANLHEDSDIDLAVIWHDTGEPKRQRSARLRASIGFVGTPLDLLTYTVAEWESERKNSLYLAYEIDREGKALYDRHH